MRSWWPLGSSSPAALLVSVHPGGSGTGQSHPKAGQAPSLSLWGLQAAPHVPWLRGVVQPRSCCGAFRAKSWCPGEEPNLLLSLGQNLLLVVQIKLWLCWVLRQGGFVCPLGRSWMLHGAGAVPEGCAGAGRWDTFGTLGSMSGDGDGAAFSSSQRARAQHGAVPEQCPEGQ